MIILQTVSFSTEACVSGDAFAFHSLDRFIPLIWTAAYLIHVRFYSQSIPWERLWDAACRVCRKFSSSDCLELLFPRLSGKFIIMENVTCAEAEGNCKQDWWLTCSVAVISCGRWYQIRCLNGRVAQILAIWGGRRRGPVPLCEGTSCNGWIYWGKSSGLPERSDELVVRGLQRAQGERTDMEREEKYFRYLICHWSYHKPPLMHKGLLINWYFLFWGQNKWMMQFKFLIT